MGGTKCLRLGTCELECMGGVLQNDLSISIRCIRRRPHLRTALCTCLCAPMRIRQDSLKKILVPRTSRSRYSTKSRASSVRLAGESRPPPHRASRAESAARSRRHTSITTQHINA